MVIERSDGATNAKSAEPFLIKRGGCRVSLSEVRPSRADNTTCPSISKDRVIPASVGFDQSSARIDSTTGGNASVISR